MNDYVLYVIALSLAVDCFVVSIAIGSNLKISNKFKYLIPIHFSVFHAMMILLGYFLGVSFLEIIESFDHVIAFALLFFVGFRMSRDSFKPKNRSYEKLNYSDILLLSLATSIDALAIGIAFNFIEGFILFESFVIGVSALLFSTLGIFIGGRIKKYKFGYLGFIGGMILIGLGVKIFVEHVFLS